MDKKPVFYGWWIVAGCFLLTFTGIGIAINSIGVFLKPVTESLGFDRGEFSLYFTIAALSMALAAPFMGKLLSKYNIRVVMGIATTLLALSFFLYSQSTQLIHFYLLSIVLGIGSAGTHVIPVALLITNWFKEKRGVAIAIALAGSGIGGMLFNPVANYLITTYSWQSAYMILGGILAITTIPVALFVVRLHPSEMGLKAYGDTAEITETTAELKGFSLGEAVKTPGFWLLALVLLMIGVMNMGVQHHVPAYLNDVGHSPAFAANIVAIFMGVLVLGKIALGAIFDRYGPRVGVIFIFTIFALASFILTGSHIAAIAILFGLVFGFANAIMTIPAPLLTAELFGQKNYGVIYGVMSICYTIGSGIGMPLSGAIFDKTGSYLPAFYLYIGMALLAMVVAILALNIGGKALAAHPDYAQGEEISI
ncbi:MAG: MFS transporter [Syntrophomonadaceae bacterium]|jgi:MFS family permease|nr:MFS transporter [Syntrophomonadaceae bacterium]HQD91541.1 MFS transporter [Syntrophomonadaceae bacterium]